jgi:Holliday junction resolvase RusA-like endonuclease
VLPFDFIVQGIPRSVNSTSRKSKRSTTRWKEKVRSAAAVDWPSAGQSIGVPVCARIIYFHTGRTELDIDNIIKPILDALKGSVLEDDKLVYEVTCRKTEQVPGLRINTAPTKLTDVLGRILDFVYIRITYGPDHSELPP